jgi:hypothetical protein
MVLVTDILANPLAIVIPARATVVLSHITRAPIESGSGLLFIDLKGDRDTIEKFTGFPQAANRADDLKIFSLESLSTSATYNLVGRGTQTQLRDRIMMSLNWSEEYYRNQSASFLLKLLYGLC